MSYSYKEELRKDIMDYVEENGIDIVHGDSDDIREQLYDDLFTEDSVTGNASGSYFCNAWKAREAVFGDENAEDYIRELISDYGLDAGTIAEHFMDWEYWDVSIRCYLLGEVIDDILTDYCEGE